MSHAQSNMELSDFLVNWKKELASHCQTQDHNNRHAPPVANECKELDHEKYHPVAGTKRFEEEEEETEMVKDCKRSCLSSEESSALFVLPAGGNGQVVEQNSALWLLCPAGSGGGGGGKLVESPSSHTSTRNEDQLQTSCLVDTLIADLDEINTIPFFEIQLPREIAVVIFGYLSMQDLCHCSMVSKSWQSLANDNILWFRHCRVLGYHLDSTIDRFPSWKTAVKDLILWSRSVEQNWKERMCVTISYQPDNEGCLCSAVYSNKQLLACYSSGECYVWDLEREGPVKLHQTSPSLHCAPSSVAAVSDNVAFVGTEQGGLKVYDTVERSEVYHHKDLDHVSYIAAASTSGITGAAVSSGRSYSTLHVFTAHSDSLSTWQCSKVQLPMPGELRTFKVLQMNLVPTYKESPEDIFLILYSTQASLTLQGASSPYSKATHLLAAPGDRGACCVNCFCQWKRHVACGTYNWMYSVKLFDLTNGAHYSTLHGHTAAIRCIQFHCNNTGFSPWLVTGSEDRRVHVYDTRQQRPCLRLIGHTSSVQCVQMDGWKVVSGGRDGMVVLWDQRMGRQLWHVRERHPVHVCHFEESSLIVAHVPTYRPAESPTNSPHSLHIRERGMIRVLDFSADPLTYSRQLPSICSSAYDEPSASFFNLDLKYPYDSIP